MSQSSLKALVIEHLRGSVVPFTLPFDKNKKLTVVYGENGTGKSTICDAFDFLGKGRVGSLENRGLGKTNRYWPSAGKTPADVSVSLETQGSTCTGRVQKSEVVCAPADGRPRVEVLRRGQILSLLEASPSDRYTAIRAFIDVSGAESSEGSLRDLIRSLDSNRDIAVARVQENRDTIQHFWTNAGSPGDDPLPWADAECSREIETDNAELKALSGLRFAFGRLADLPSRIDAATENVALATKRSEAAIADEQRVVNEAAGGAREVVEILQAAQSFLRRQGEVAACPLCESSQNTAGLAEKVEQRLASFSAVQRAQSATTIAAQAVQLAQQQLQSVLAECTRAVADFEKSRTGFTWPADIKMATSAAPEPASALTVWLDANADLPSEWSRAEATRQDRKQFIGTLRAAVKTLRDNTEAQTNLDRLLPRLGRALEIVTEERRQFTDKILSDIATSVGELYEEVHPGEGLNKISLELDPKKRASLDIGVSFAGQDAPPQAYFSDSHLDTLGLCVFLALAQLTHADETILVLDDVLASVDEPHVERLIEMLHAQAVKFRHCVITTHYRPWKMKLRWGWLKNGQCHFVELTRWTNSSGLTLMRTVPDLQKLRELLAANPIDAQLVCAKAGFILEAALNFITLLYECSVARKPDDRYTLGDLLPSVDKKLRKALNVERKMGVDSAGAALYERISLAPILDELHRIAQARNVFGCHFNALSFDLLEADGLLFGRNVLELMECLTDEEGGWPRNGKSGSYWATSGETRRLSPYKRPT